MIITSLLDTDLYKFTMMQVVLHQFPGAQVELARWIGERGESVPDDAPDFATLPTSETQLLSALDRLVC